MADQQAVGGFKLPDIAGKSITDLEETVAGLEQMVAGAKRAGADTTDLERTVAGMRQAIEGLKRIPGV